MTITIMNNSTALSLAEIKGFLKSTDNFEFQSVSKCERNEWIQAVIMHHRYLKCRRRNKIILRRYMMRITGLSKAQITRLIYDYRKRATLKPKEYIRNIFKKTYTKADIELLARVDNAHERLSGPATAEIMRDEFNLFGNTEFERLKNISVAHLYRLRRTPRYRENTKTFSKTKPTQANIGERRKPEPNGKPGYLCVDTVHQGDKEGEKGVYHVNMVDMSTQYEFVGSTEAISEYFMEKILNDLIEQCDFKIVEFHADNGSEYINKIVAKLLNKLLIKLTKSRPRKSNDNALAETKNGAVIRKHMGYIHIPRSRADEIHEFYKNHFNDYLNYHRPCAFPKITVDKRGKERKTYPRENYMIPYAKLKSIPNAEQYLKPGITFKQLDKIAYAMSHTEYAKIMQNEKTKLFNKLFK